jgi:hypothetical protein
MKTYPSTHQNDALPTFEDEDRSAGPARNDEPAWDARITDESLPAYSYRRFVE